MTGGYFEFCASIVAHKESAIYKILERCDYLKRVYFSIKYCGVLVSATLLILLLVACDNETYEQHEVQINNEFFESYAYRFDMDSSYNVYVSDFIHGTFVHDGRIYFYYVETDVVEAELDVDGNVDIDTLEPPVSTIIIESMYPDGTRVSRTEIENAGKFISILGFRITEAENFILLFTDSNFAHLGDDIRVIYAEYSPQGIELARHEITGLAQRGNRGFYLRQVLFVDDGMVLLVSTDDSTFLYVVDEHYSVHSQTELDAGTQAMIPMVQTDEGRVFVYFTELSRGTRRSTLREFYTESANWGERLPISGTGIRAMYPASGDTNFDFYIDDGVYLFGYNVEAEEKTTILSWSESRISAGLGSHLNFLENGQISILTDRNIFSDDHYMELTILNRIDRVELPDYTIITLGGVDITRRLSHIQPQVTAFNQQSQTHQIEIVDYFDPVGDNIAWHAARTRLSVDIMTGRAPDIILADPLIMSPIAEAGFLLDLYEFIDNDPDLSRSDFIPNILSAQEASDGSLPAIFYEFELIALIGMAGTVGDPEAWNLEKMLSLIEETTSSDTESIIRSNFQFDLRANQFISRILTDPNLGFINMEENTADLDNEEFKRILEIASNFPHGPIDWDEHVRQRAAIDAQSVGIARMSRGEILFSDIVMLQISDYQLQRKIVGDDLVFLGWPSLNNGSNMISFIDGLGISATSNSPDEAWEFIREFLLPEAVEMPFSPTQSIFDFRFPLRVDILDDMILEAMTPMTRVDANGNEVEAPRNIPYIDILIPFTTPIYAMTEVEAEEFREIIANATIMRAGVGDVVGSILEEELPIFFSGTRSAADTVRVLQNRIQRFLDEQS